MGKSVQKRPEGGTLFDIESPMAIELRRIMIRLSRMIDLDKKCCLMVTSAERGEGKSLFALHFSLVLAYHLKQQVLLIDADVRRPVQHTVFNVQCSPGLAEHLAADQPDLNTKSLSTRIPNLKFLPAGVAGDHPSRLFSGGRFLSAIKHFHQDHDIIILDAPPVVPVSDPLHYVEAVDGVLFIVMAGQTSRDLAVRGVDILQSVDANILGVIANNLGEVLPYYYDQKYYGYNKHPGDSHTSR